MNDNKTSRCEAQLTVCGARCSLKAKYVVGERCFCRVHVFKAASAHYAKALDGVIALTDGLSNTEFEKGFDAGDYLITATIDAVDAKEGVWEM